MSRRLGIAGVALGVVFLLGAVLWSTVAVPELVKFPLSTSITLHYSGNLVTYVNPSTGGRLATPTTAPLTIDRTIRAIGSRSSSSVAVVSENLVLSYPGHRIVEDNQYALNRRTMANVSSPSAYTFSSTNKGAAPGSYYVTLPMNITPGKTEMSIWKPETGTTYRLVSDTSAGLPSSLDGMAVSWFKGTLPMTPVTGYERSALASRGFPMSLSPTQVDAQLAAAGLSVSGLSLALLPHLALNEARELIAIMTKPVPLRYFSFGSGLVAAETRSGAIIDLDHVVDGIAVSPVTTGLTDLSAVLSRHTNIAGVSGALSALRRMASLPPSPVYELQYSQTASSILDMVLTTNSQLAQIYLAEEWIPLGALVLGAVFLLGGAGVIWRRRSPPPEVSAGGGAAGEALAA